MLRVEGLHAGYGDVVIVRDLNLSVAAGRCLAVLGPNGAGKSTTLRTIMGELPAQAGRVILDDVDVTGWRTSERVREGIVLVAQERLLFANLSVRENLQVPLDALRPRRDRTETWSLADVHELFPILADRGMQVAGSLSGGQQQMLAIGRALLSQPRCLMLDEPLGLAPIIVTQLLAVLATLKTAGLAIILVEQQVDAALKLADRAIFLQRGTTVMAGAAEELRGDPEVLRSYLGGPR